MAHNKDFYGDGRIGDGGNIANTMRGLFTNSRMDPDLQRQLIELVNMFTRQMAFLESKIETLSRVEPAVLHDAPAGAVMISDGEGGFDYVMGTAETGQISWPSAAPGFTVAASFLHGVCVEYIEF